jgi:NAD(P)-dependent dehydrogenase (short-subunit alcohol dehydrogenase family)
MGKVWLVTGSARGLGLSIVEAALNSGASVIATARNPSQLQHFVEKHGTEKILPLALDVTNDEQVAQAVKAGHEKFGRIDVVVNNAGYADLASVEEVTIENFRKQMDTNFYGVVHVTKAVLPILRLQGSGHIIQVSSLGGRLGTPGLSAYQSAKWAVGGFSTVLSQEVAPLGIKVTVLEPGGIRTEWAGSSMKIPPISEPYKQTVGFWAELLRTTTQNVSEPSKVAEIVLKVSELEEPPLRLVVGKEAVNYAKQTAQVLAMSDEKWHDLSVSA